jgi:4-alpha-glucanotransferase
MPIYVALDSVDVWMNKSDFLLDKDNYPTLVAGCPPDGFSPDGQLWGNPIYNWEKMKQDNFSWWIKRIKRHLELYDIIRIDHFRGFAGYYAIPYGDATARYGAWHSAPGKELFKTVNETFNDAKIIAEDLGFITPDVRELLEFTGYPGMKILQFAFYDEDAEFLPRMYKTSNCVVYTGSHDADCTYTWIKNIEGDAKKRFKKECLEKTTYKGVYAMIYLALSSTANLSIIPIQDYLCLTNEEGRMNTPSTASGNWTYRLSNRYNTNTLKEKIKTITLETSFLDVILNSLFIPILLSKISSNFSPVFG